MPPEIRKLAGKYSAKAIQTLVECLDDPSGSVRVRAAEILLDRAHGKATQAVEVTGQDGGPLVIAPPEPLPDPA